MNVLELKKVLSEEQNLEYIIDTIFELFDEKFINRKFPEIDFILGCLDLNEYPTKVIIPIVTAASWGKSELVDYNIFFNRVEKILVERHGEDHTRKILRRFVK